MSAVEAPARPQPAIRDQLADHLLTPQNAALIVIDYQPSQFAAIRSIDQQLLTKMSGLDSRQPHSSHE